MNEFGFPFWVLFRCTFWVNLGDLPQLLHYLYARLKHVFEKVADLEPSLLPLLVWSLIDAKWISYYLQGGKVGKMERCVCPTAKSRAKFLCPDDFLRRKTNCEEDDTKSRGRGFGWS